MIFKFCGNKPFFFSVELSDGTIQAELDTGCIPQSVLREIWSMRRQGISFEDIVERLRPRTVPSGYTYHNWTPGMFLCACTCIL